MSSPQPPAPIGHARRVRVLRVIALLVLLSLAAFGLRTLIEQLRARARQSPALQAWVEPTAVNPGPPLSHPDPSAYRLDSGKARRMRGMDVAHQRWCDVAGHFYASEFADGFSYHSSPTVFVHVDASGPTLSGRLEARGLKPNFAYQLKLRGVAEDFESFERIGYAGRWRLPGGGTNFTDEEYRAIEDPTDAEAYFFFDFFVTDAAGNAIRNFAADASLHVLWLGAQRLPYPLEASRSVLVDASDSARYLRPEPLLAFREIWAEREHVRYRGDSGRTRFLPAGEYRAEIVLTEETFHALEADGGYWPTVMLAPVRFTVTSLP